MHYLNESTVLKETLLKFLKLDNLIDSLTGYVESRVELLKIEIREEVVKSLSKALVLAVFLAVITLFVLMISFAAAFKIAESLGASAGFAIVGSIYLVIGLALYLFRNTITEKLEKQLASKMEKEE